jgi:DNA-binding response OmpR family regulator
MTISLEPKEKAFAKLHELDAALQTAINVRTELWSLVADLPSLETLVDIEIPLTFYEKGYVIAWGDDSEHFTSLTFEFLRRLWFAPKHTLSKRDIRKTVIGDPEATDNAIWVRIKNARQELREVDFPYELETLYDKGYRLKAK